ncbi:MAG: glycosyltransferase family 39 protein, partial [Anaerolineae bacterium]|nr:glycosyltransferase family 39 protein [Anaerolineae bacterium]
TVLLTSLWVVAVYWLVRRLLGSQVALLAGLLIALDPFHIALSRVIHHDALSTIFMTLSALTMLVYWGHAAGRKWLLLSGVLAGFGFLSKSPALFLMPFVAAVGLWFAVKAIRAQPGSRSMATISTILARTVGDGLLWFAVAAAVFVIFWPAMWVIPRETLETVFFIGSKYATGGHAKGNFFWGTISKDPGPLFYVASWLYRVSPMVILGVLVAAAGGWRAWRARNDDEAAPLSQFRRYAPLVWLFIIGYFILVAVSEKKQERYFLPVYPWLNLIGAVGLAALGRSQIGPLKSGMQRLLVVVMALLVVNGGLVAVNYPYYFTYYNPLFGGIRGAEQVLTIGWGEGLDLAADYLNQKETNHPRVASWYQSTFAPYYEGEAISYSKEKGKVLAGDYAVFYINQTQRRFPDDTIFDYFEARFEPEQTITLHGLDYAWIYPSLGIDHYVEDQTYTGIASLLAWQWRNGDQPLVAGQAAEFELYWEYLGKQPEEAFFFRLVDRQGRAWAEGTSLPVA